MLPQEIIRAKRDGRALTGEEIGEFIAGLTSGAIERRSDRGVRHGGFLSRHEHRRARASHARHDAFGRSARLERGRSARPDRRQAFHRRNWRQRQPDAGADARRLRSLRADDFGARPRPYRRDARQARLDPRLRHAARNRALSRRRRGGRLRDHRPDRRARARRQTALRDPRRHRHGRVRSRSSPPRSCRRSSPPACKPS